MSYIEEFMYTYLLLFLFISLCNGEVNIDIKDAGIANFTDDDIAIIFYVTLENKSDKDLEIFVYMVQCCENTKPYENDCSSMFLMGGDMGILYSKCIKNITLIYPNLYLTNRQGVCTVSIKYKDGSSMRQLLKDIRFTTIRSEDQCDTLDLDGMQNCSPVDCVIKYSGEKSYFNPKCRECERVPVCISNPKKCLAETFYSIASNNCTELKEAVIKNDLEMLENNQVDGNNCGLCTSNIVCHYGSLDNDGRCECENDWVTMTDDEVYEPSLLLYHMCNIEVGAWNSVNKGKIRTTALIIGIFAITIASKILILMCVLNWCYKHFKTSKKIPTCSDKLDPYDESIILCEDLSNFDRCICEEPPKQSSKILHTQTVNVSYYPCSPSIFSTVHCSTGSEKEQHAIQSEQSIMLSRTTSSSVQLSFQSDSETSSNSNDVVDEENYHIEFSGEEGDDGSSDEKLRAEDDVDEGLINEESEYSRSNKDSVSSKSKNLSKSSRESDVK